MKKLVTYILGLLMATSWGISSVHALAIPAYIGNGEIERAKVTANYLNEYEEKLAVPVDFADNDEIVWYDDNGSGVVDGGDTVSFTVIVSDGGK